MEEDKDLKLGVKCFLGANIRNVEGVHYSVTRPRRKTNSSEIRGEGCVKNDPKKARSVTYLKHLLVYA